MGRFDDSALGDYAKQAKQPAAPVGLQDYAGAMANNRDAIRNTALGRVVAQEGYTPVAQRWYTGANPNGTGNGWDTQFVSDFMSGQEKAAKQGTLASYFAQPDATGVVTWDHKSEDGTKTYRFGDVYRNGKHDGNVYDQFDHDTANLMMADWLFDGTTKRKIFSDKNDPTGHLDAEVTAKRERNAVDIPKAYGAMDFQKHVDATEQRFREGHVDEAIVGGSVAGAAAIGAGAGAAAGSFFFGVGALPGALVGGAAGAAAGFLGGFLNQDAMTEQAARAYEVTAASQRENGTGAAVATGLAQWSGFSGKLISPVSNITQGVYDKAQGKVGDGTSEFYRVDKSGKSHVSKWMKVADVAAAVTDSASQFATPIGAGLYTAQMGGTISGEVAELGITGGKSFDYSRGGFDSIYRDDAGHVDMLRAAAGIGKVGIDAVQMGMARGILSKAQAARAAVGQDAVGATRSGVFGRLGERLYGGTRAKNEIGEAAGFKFFRAADGTVEKKMTLSMLAPSEQLQALSARVIAMRAAARKTGAYSADDFYRASQSLASGTGPGGSRMKTLLVNGMGEAYEEGVQQVLDPYSHNARISAGEIFQAAAYGFAGGVGMQGGASLRSPSAANQMRAIAQANYQIRTGVELSDAGYNSMTETERRVLAAQTPVEAGLTKAAFQKVIRDQSARLTANVEGVYKLADAGRSMLAQATNTATTSTDQSFVIVQTEHPGQTDGNGHLTLDSHPSDSVVSSAMQLAHNFTNRMRGAAAMLQSLQRDLDTANQTLASNPSDEAAQTAAQTAQQRIDKTELMLSWAQRVDQELSTRINRIGDAMASQDTVTARDLVEAESVSLNAWLRDAYNRQIDATPDGALTDDDKMALARAVSQVVTRYPQDQSGSFQVLVPQVSPKLTLELSDNVLEISHAILPAIRGDYDGDKISTLQQLLLDDEEFTTLRSGAQMLGAGSSVNVKAPAYEEWVLTELAEAYTGTASLALQNAAVGTLVEIGTAIRNRYLGTIPDSVLDSVLTRFFESAQAGSPDTRKVLLDGLANEAGGPINAYARQHLSNEWLWIDQLVRATTQRFQGVYAAHAPDLGDPVNTNVVAPLQQADDVKERKAARAATTGMWLGLVTAGETMFRKFQKLHYSKLTAAVLSAETPAARQEILDMAAVYEAAGSGLTQSELDNARGKDDITTRVFAQLLRIANDAKRDRPELNTIEAVVLVANMGVLDFDIDENNNITTSGKEVTLAQMLLKRSVQQDRREKDIIYAASKELQAKHHKLLNMTKPPTQGVKGSRPVNAQRAFVEVLGSQQLITLLGDEAYVFGPHLTMEQFLRSYIAMHETDRKREDMKMKGEAAYLGRTETHNIPYNTEEVAAGQVSAFRSVVDSMIAVGHNRITMDDEGKLHGELANRSNDTSRDFVTQHKTLRVALARFTELNPRRENETDLELVSRMFEAHPDTERLVWDMLPANMVNAVLEVRDRKVHVANWVFSTFLVQDSAEAEMHLWRNLLLARWNAGGGLSQVIDEEDETGHAGRKFDSLKTRMERIMWTLAALDDGGLLYEKFIRELESATSLEEFITWVNTEPSIRGQQAPIVAWVDDVAEFDADKAKGGWSTALAGAELRLGMTALKEGAQSLVKSLAEEKIARDKDVRTLRAIKRVIDFEAGDTSVKVLEDDRKMYAALVQAIAEVEDGSFGLGPGAMLFQTMGAVEGFNIQSHTKGLAPVNVEALGAFEAIRDAYGYTENFSRVLGSLTSLNLDAVSQSLHMVATDAGRSMDDEGREVRWDRLTPAAVVEMLLNPDTRALARAELFPQVMDRDSDGKLRPKLLVDKDLRSLLDGTSHQDLFKKHGRLSQDSALRYLSSVETGARKYGGSFAVQRTANDMAIARISAADHVLSFREREQLVLQTYQDIAAILQDSASRVLQKHDPGTDPLADIREKAKKVNHELRLKRKLGVAPTSDAFEVDFALNELLTKRELQAEADKREAELAINPVTPAEHRQLQSEIDAIDASVKEFADKLELLKVDDLVHYVRSMFAIPRDPSQASDTKVKLVNYVQANMAMLNPGGSGLALFQKITTQLLDPAFAGQPRLSEDEWLQLSNLVIGHYLDQAASNSAPGVAWMPFPDADHEADWRYFDRSFGYLLDPLMTESSPLVQAARDLQSKARLFSVVATDDEIIQTLNRTIFAEFRFGEWTSDIYRASVEANKQIDTASAPQAISMVGISPMTQAVISAAGRRTFELPDASQLSSTTLSWLDLGKDDFDTVEVTHPGAAAVLRPVVQLNNRFASSVTMRYTDDAGVVQELDLLHTDSDLGRPFLSNPIAAGSGFQEVRLDRIKTAVRRATEKLGVSPVTAMVSMEFFHPDLQPPDWHNNLFFEGTVFAADADNYQSLNGAQWFADGSLNPVFQNAALDAQKNGTSALTVVPGVTSTEREAIEAQWTTDFAGMLRAKTELMFNAELGFGKMPTEFYNTVYKNMKMRHFVVGTNPDTGEPITPLTAEQVIAHQLAGTMPPLNNAKLWIPSDDVLREMLGEQGKFGTSRILHTDLGIDLAAIDTWKGITPEIATNFAQAFTGESLPLTETRVMHRARQSKLYVSAKQDTATETAYEIKMKFFRELKDQIYTDRSQIRRLEGDDGFNPRNAMRSFMAKADGLFSSESIPLDWLGMGFPLINPRNDEDVVLAKMLVHQEAAARHTDSSRMGWIYEEGAASNPPEGKLSDASLVGNYRPGHMVAPGDGVLLMLDAFDGDFETARKRVDYFAGRGATIMLGATDGAANLRAELASYLEGAAGYLPIHGVKHAFQPAEYATRYQNQRARISSLVETRGISTRNMVANLLTKDLAVAENSSWVNPDSSRMNSIGVVVNLLPTDFLAGFNVPVTTDTANDPFAVNATQVAMVQQQLRSLDTAEGRQMLMDMAASEKWSPEERAAADGEFQRAWDDMIRRFDANPGGVLPPADSSFGYGDMIPLVDGHGHVLIYRHGMKAPSRRRVNEMAATIVPNEQGDTGAANVAIFTGKPEPLARKNRGTVTAFNPRSGYGLQVELDVDLQLFGDKLVLEWNGMKYLVTPKPDSVVLPSHGIFANGWSIDLISSLHDTISKESFDGLVNNFRNAFAYFGVDFLPDVAKFFGVQPAQARELLHAFATRAPRIPLALADELINAGHLDRSFLAAMPELAAQLSTMADPAWVTALTNQASPEAKITAAMLVYLSTPGAKVEHVLRSGGFNDDTATLDSQSVLMPQLFTQVFDREPLESPLRDMMIERVNDQLHNPNTDGTGYRMLKNWTFEVRNADPSKNISGMLQFAEAHSSGDNPIKNGQAFDEDERAPISPHSASIGYQAVGGITTHAYDISKAQAFLEGEGVTRFDGADTGAVWQMLNGIDRDSVGTGSAWRAPTPVESLYQSLGRDAVVQFRQSLSPVEENGWHEADGHVKTYRDLSLQLVRALGLQDSQVGIVDYWVRQMLGQPKGTVRSEYQEVTGDGAIQAVTEMLLNVREGYLPLIATEVPLLHVNDLQLIHRANAGKPGGWAPYATAGDPNTAATSWDEWTKISLGQALTSDNWFDPLYLTALDGFMHTYQNATRSLTDIPVSLDVLKGLDLLDENTNRMLVSIEEGNDELLSDPIVLDSMHASIDELLGGKRIAGKFQSKTAPSHIVAKRREARRKWRLETGTPAPLDVSMRNFRKVGAEYVNQSTTTNAAIRMLINLRVGTALLNPALYLSMGPEQWVRGVLDRTANLLTGQSTAGMTARAAAYAHVSQYSPEQLKKMNQLTRTLGKRNDFKAMVYSDLMFLRPHISGISKVEKVLEGYAKMGSRIQDPTWGMSAKTLARRYLEAVLQHINADPLSNAITTDQLIIKLSSDPLFLKNNFLEAHQAGTNAIAQMRSLKMTVASQVLRSIYEPMSASSHVGVNVFGNLFLKLPMLFSGYAMNVLTTITGLQGLDQMTASFMHGRQTPNSLLGRAAMKMRGETLPEEADSTFDMSSVMEGIDLSRAFIRGGLTHTGLFAFGLMAGGLGLSGEDDETKKRRRMAELQGAGFVYDPRRIENDFRNVDAVFLDWLPFGMDSWFQVTGSDAPGGARSMAQLNWTLKQFVSPIIGMEKFFETGDFRQVTWGFQDAVGAFPIINTLMWSDAVSTAHELASVAGDEDKLGSAANLPKAAWLLTNATGVYERMLFENAFVNQLYTSFDRYDRDPYKMPLRDSDGTVQRDIHGDPRANDLALESYIDPVTHEVKQGFQSRSTDDATLHALTENRATLAFALSMFTGFGDSDYIRHNMPIKTRSLDKPVTSQAEAEAVIRAAMQGQAVLGHGLANLSADELAQKWKDEFRAKGVFVDWGKIDAAAAKAFARGQEGTGVPAALSMLDAKGAEVLTEAGARGVMNGLVKGTAKLDSPSLAGIFIPFEMREKIQKEWMHELVQEGVNLGLDQTKATSRMKRLWYGPTDDPTIVGIGDLLWSKDISYSQKIVYNQLNTTYVMGPDGKPWATGFDRGSLMSSLGIAPVKRALISEQSATGNDFRLNTTDLINGLNTGLRGLELVDKSEYVPTDVEIGKAIEDAIRETAQQPFTPFPQSSSSGHGFTPFRRFGGFGRRSGFGGFGGGGFSDFGSRPFFSKMFALPGGTSPYANSIPFINTSNPILRRANIRRERVWSERGRLKQWQ